jgi:hypothetical protein
VVHVARANRMNLGGDVIIEIADRRGQGRRTLLYVRTLPVLGHCVIFNSETAREIRSVWSFSPLGPVRTRIHMLGARVIRATYMPAVLAAQRCTTVGAPPVCLVEPLKAPPHIIGDRLRYASRILSTALPTENVDNTSSPTGYTHARNLGHPRTEGGFLAHPPVPR